MRAWQRLEGDGLEPVLKHRRSPTEVPLVKVRSLADARAELVRVGMSQLVTKDEAIELAELLMGHIEEIHEHEVARARIERDAAADLRERLKGLIGRLAADARTGPPPVPGTRWGNWVFTGNAVERGHYRIELEQLATAEDVVRFAQHLGRKDWSNDDIVSGMEAVAVSSRAAIVRRS